MAMGWEYVSEQRPPTSLLFVPQVIHGLGEPWCNGMLTEKNSSLLHQSSLAILPAESSGSKQEEWVKGMRIWPCQVFLFILASYFLHAVKSYDMGPTALLPLRRKVCCGFLSPLKIHRLGWVWTREPWVQWQASHPLYHRGQLNTTHTQLYRLYTFQQKNKSTTDKSKTMWKKTAVQNSCHLTGGIEEPDDTVSWRIEHVSPTKANETQCPRVRHSDVRNSKPAASYGASGNMIPHIQFY